MIEQFKTLKENYQAMKKQYTTMIQESGQEIFFTLSKELFAQYPELHDFSWRQYTPYFNDGESCNFTAHTDYPKINTSEDIEIFDEDGVILDRNVDDLEELSEWNFTSAKYSTKFLSQYHLRYGFTTPETFKNTCLAVMKFLSQFDQDDLELIFGDHVSVMVTRKGIEVEDYEHD